MKKGNNRTGWHRYRNCLTNMNHPKTTKKITSFDEHLDKRYGKIGSEKRTEFEIKAKAFAIGEVIKEERHLAHLTQEQLAEKTGTKKVSFPELKTVTATYNFQPYTDCWKQALAERYRFPSHSDRSKRLTTYKRKHPSKHKPQ